MKNFTYTIISQRKVSFMFLLVTFLIVSALQANAQTLYKASAAADVDVTESFSIEAASVPEPSKELKCEGSYLIKDGQLDNIYNLKFVLPSVQLKAQSTNSIIGEKKITFEQTHVMVLPMMGMVHVVGALTIGDVSNTGSFLLKFKVNSDESISFNGEKTVKLIQYYPDVAVKTVDELQLELNFVLKKDKANLKGSATK